MLYSQLTQPEKLSLIQSLQTMRNSLAKKNKEKKASVKRPSTKKSVMHFVSPELEKLFNSMSPECRKLLQ